MLINHCDICGEKGKAYYIPVGTYCDPCDGTQTDSKHIDLCPNCLVAHWDIVVKGMDYDTGKKLYDKLCSKRLSWD